MAIRRITDLPQVNYDVTLVTANELKGKPELRYSAFETSYNTNGDEHSQFQSKQISFEDLSGLMLHNIWSEDCTFDGDKTFNGQVNFRNDLKLSGSVYLNEPGNAGENVLSVNVKNIQEKATNYANYLSKGQISVDAPTINVTATNLKTNVKSNEEITVGNDYIVNANKITFNSNSTIDLNSNKNCTVNLRNNNSNFSIKRGNIDIMYTANDNCVYFNNTIQGTSLQALWADLAENYEADFKYEPGTLVKFGGEKEITIADDNADAVVTTNPGFVLNAYSDNTVGIALVGRVPVKVVGKIKKFDNIVLSYINGVGRAQTDLDKHCRAKIIGKALQSNESDDIKLVECVVRLSF